MPSPSSATVPETDAEWFALIEPEIAVTPVEADASDAIELAKQHAAQVVERTGMETDLNRVDWQASRELRSKLGYANGHRVKLSMDALVAGGWQSFFQVVRHELVHVWQGQNRNVDSGHGESFEQWMPILNIKKSGNKMYPVWTIECPSCESVVERISKRVQKQIAEQIHGSNPIVCYDCDKELSDYILKREGETVPVDELPAVPSPAQKQVVLYNRTAGDSQASERDWVPKTRSLLDLTGMGDKTVMQIGDDIQRIEDLIETNAQHSECRLAETVREAVSAQYHDELRKEIHEWYQEALDHQSEDEETLFERVLAETDEWWKPIESTDETGKVEAMCRKLRDEITETDHVQLSFEDHGEHVVQITEKVTTGQIRLGAEIETASPPIGPKGIIQVPEPSHGSYPTFEHRQKLEGGSLEVNCHAKIIRVEKADRNDLDR